QKRVDIAGSIEATFGNGHQRSRQRESVRNENKGLKALVARQRSNGARHGDGMAARQQAVLGIIEPNDLMNALDADVEHTAVLRDRFRIVPAARREWPAIGTEHRRHLGVPDAGGSALIVENAPSQPPSLVAYRNKVRAILGNAHP